MSIFIKLTPDEKKAIKKLQTLAKTWPPSLTIFGQSGTMQVIKDLTYIVSNVCGIHCDGGDSNLFKPVRQLIGKARSKVSGPKWRLSGPDGSVYEFCNMTKFVRDHADLFRGQILSKASQRLSRLRPTHAQPLSEWKGWKWGGEISTSES